MIESRLFTISMELLILIGVCGVGYSVYRAMECDAAQAQPAHDFCVCECNAPACPPATVELKAEGGGATIHYYADGAESVWTADGALSLCEVMP